MSMTHNNLSSTWKNNTRNKMIWSYSNHKYTKKIQHTVKVFQFLFFWVKFYCTLLSSASLREFNCFSGLVDLKRQAEKRVALTFKSASGFPRTEGDHIKQTHPIF